MKASHIAALAITNIIVLAIVWLLVMDYGHKFACWIIIGACLFWIVGASSARIVWRGASYTWVGPFSSSKW
jgi:hypothetical protein